MLELLAQATQPTTQPIGGNLYLWITTGGTLIVLYAIKKLVAPLYEIVKLLTKSYYDWRMYRDSREAELADLHAKTTANTTGLKAIAQVVSPLATTTDEAIAKVDAIATSPTIDELPKEK